MKRLVISFAALALVLGLAGFAFPRTIGAQNIFDGVCNNRVKANSTVCQEQKKTQTPENNSIYGPDGVITKIVNIIALVAGVAAVIFIIIGGIKYILSSGDPASITSAKNTIVYAIVGVVVVIAARTIIAFVINKL